MVSHPTTFDHELYRTLSVELNCFLHQYNFVAENSTQQSGPFRAGVPVCRWCHLDARIWKGFEKRLRRSEADSGEDQATKNLGAGKPWVAPLEIFSEPK